MAHAMQKSARMTNTNFETVAIDDLHTTTGGVTARWLANHPYAADAFLAHHPARAGQFAQNHPFAYARIRRIGG
jgi:hypothetical protein